MQINQSYGVSAPHLQPLGQLYAYHYAAYSLMVISLDGVSEYFAHVCVGALKMV